MSSDDNGHFVWVSAVGLGWKWLKNISCLRNGKRYH